MENIATAPARPPVFSVKTTTCFHCHDPIKDGPTLFLNEKPFCCEGCKMVFEILNAHDLCQFYALDTAPGLSQKIRKDARAWAFLDDPDVREKLLQFTDGATAKTTFLLPAMHCASCIWLLENLWKLDGGITHSRVNFLKKEVVIQFDEQKTGLRKIAALLASIGYAPEINLGDLDPTARPVDRSLIYKIGVAGFAFGNIMLLSFPEYLGLEREKEAWFFAVFGWLNLVLALPVLLYSARDYFISAYNGLKIRHLNLDVPLALGAAMLFGRSAWEIVSGTGAGFMDSFAGLIFFLNIGKWFQQKTFHQLSFERDYRSYFPISATRKRPGGLEETVAVNRLEPGDLIAIRNAELIPADGILIRGRAAIDYSFVTGEAEPQAKTSGDKLFAGGKQVGETIEISLTRRVSQSYLTQLWNDESFKTGQKSHAPDYSGLADRAGRYFTTVILVVSAAAFLYWLPRSLATAVNAFTAVLIVACPCAVALSIPFTLGNVLRILGRNRFYLKNTQVIEAFGTINTAVFDKTGTLTTIADYGLRITDWVPSKPETDKSVIRNPQSAIKSLVRHSGHPMSRQIFEFLKDVPTEEVTDFQEVTGEGLTGRVGEWSVRIGKKSFMTAPVFFEKTDGTFVQINDEVVGCFLMKNSFRNGLAEVLSWFQKRWPAHLLSGDNDREAAALAPLFGSPENLHFNQSPSEKLEFIKNLEKSGQKTLMLGDGLNDAGALRAATVGIVVSENTNNFTPACDAILDARVFEKLPRFIELANEGVRIVGRAYVVAFFYNIVGLSYAVSGTLSPVVAAILMPLSSLTIVLFGTLSSNWKAWRLGLLAGEDG